MSNIKTKILIIIAVLAILSVAVWFFFGAKNEQKITENTDSSTAIFKEEKGEKTNSLSTAPLASTQTNKYENVQYGFSFNYPDGFAASEFPEDEGKISLIIQNAQTGQVIQIYITPYDDSDFAVSAERVKRDLPDLPFSNSADIVVDGKAKGTAFFSENEAFGGETAEVWFADGRNFYQATAYSKDAKMLEEIIKSWKL